MFNENGTLLQEGSYEKGREHGDWKFYSGKGQLQYSGRYEKGERKGDWYQYDRKGNKKPWKY